MPKHIQTHTHIIIKQYNGTILENCPRRITSNKLFYFDYEMKTHFNANFLPQKEKQKSRCCLISMQISL